MYSFIRFQTFPPQTLVLLVFKAWFHDKRARSRAIISAPDTQRTRRTGQGNIAGHTHGLRARTPFIRIRILLLWSFPCWAVHFIRPFLFTQGVIRRVVSFVARSFLCYVRFPFGGRSSRRAKPSYVFGTASLHSTYYILRQTGFFANATFVVPKPFYFAFHTFGQTLLSAWSNRGTAQT